MTARPIDAMPRDRGLPVIGRTPEFVRDARSMMQELARRHGDTFLTNVLFRDVVVISHPDDVKQLVLDRSQAFSSEGGWAPTIGELFSRGLMLRDFDEHRFHRRIMGAAFRRDALDAYAVAMEPIIEQHVASWAQVDDFHLYPAIKRLTLDVASALFIGERPGPELDRITAAFLDAVSAAISPVRMPLPGTAYRKGMRGRRRLEQYFRERVDDRRTASNATDTFSRLATAVDEEGERLSDDEIVDHMIFLMLAAHDTTTGTLTAMGWELARTPDWQRRIRDELEEHGESDSLDLFLNETMRWYPSVPFIPRTTTRPVEIGGYALPAGHWIAASEHVTHFRADLWDEPFTFDPERFSEERAEHRRHSHQFYPFGGGAHTCLGMTLAGLQMHAIMRHVLSAYELHPASEGQQEFFRPIPIPRPDSGLPLRLEPVRRQSRVG